MTIVVYHKLLKFRLFIKRTINFNQTNSQLYLFGNLASVDKLLTFKEVNIIITDTETVNCERETISKWNNKSKDPIYFIVFNYSNELNNTGEVLSNSFSVSLKPDTDYSVKENKTIISEGIEQITDQIKLEIQRNSKLRVERPNIPISKNIKAVLIGVSTGGPKALRKLLPELTCVTKIPIIIVQHILKNYTDAFVMTLNSISKTKVLKVHDGLAITKNLVYVAPGGIHTTVMKIDGKIVFQLDNSPPEESVKPSVNYLFRSAADVYGKDVIAIILTGMGKDGTDGAKVLSEKGAYIIAQDEISSDVWSMPHNVIQKGCVNKVLPLTEISAHISSILSNH